MISIDAIEAMNTFPSFKSYVFKYIADSLPLLFPILVVLFLFFDITIIAGLTGVSYLIIFSVLNYNLDKRIFQAFEYRRNKKSSSLKV